MDSQKLCKFLLLCIVTLAGQIQAQTGTNWTNTYGGSSADYGKAVVQTADGGFTSAGYTSSSGAGLTDAILSRTDESGVVLWSKVYGGSNYDYAVSMEQTSDGGYIIAGHTRSFGSGGFDAWLIRTDADGDTLWSQAYGGSNYDYALSVRQTGDGGFVLAGHTNSYGAGGFDMWLLRTDANGDSLWSQTYGGSGSDQAFSVALTTDDGFILCGHTTSYGSGGFDVWLVQADSLGNLLSSQTYGGSGNDLGFSVLQTGDGGYVLTGYTYSFGAGSSDMWLIRTDAALNELWTQTFGGQRQDIATTVLQTADGGYALTGYTSSFSIGKQDVWLIRTDSMGALQWSNSFGGSGNDYGAALRQTSDGGYIIAGHSDSFGAGGTDGFLIRTDAMGGTLGLQEWGGSSYDVGNSVQQTADGGFILTGITQSFGAGNADVFLTRTNGAGVTLWTKTFGGAQYDNGHGVLQTPDGGFIIAGATNSWGAGDYDMFLLKTDATGNLLWTQTYGGAARDWADGFNHTADGGFILTGHTTSYGAGSYDVWLVRTDANGNMLWSNTFGDTGTDRAFAVRETSDGGFITVGMTSSFGASVFDLYAVRTDANGVEVWSKQYGHPSALIEDAYAVEEVAGGGFTILGNADDLGPNFNQVWLLNTDANGDTLWTKTFGDSMRDAGLSMDMTSDGGYILAGYKQQPSQDILLIRTDAAGDTLWTQTYGEKFSDLGLDVRQTFDGGYVVTGRSELEDDFNTQIMLLRTDAVGQLIPAAAAAKTSLQPPRVASLPEQFILDQNYPNPFNPATTISYALPVADEVSLAVYNLLGQQIRLIVRQKQEAGSYRVQWDGRDERGRRVASGVYLYRLAIAQGQVQTRKMILLR